MDVILFLNKRDLFEDKIKTVDPKAWFPEYSGGCNYSNAEKFFRNEFEKRLYRGDAGSKRLLYTYSTCATDTQNVKHVFDSMYDRMLEKAQWIIQGNAPIFGGA